MKTRRDRLQWFFDRYKKEDLLSDPSKAKSVLLDSGIDKTDASMIVDLMTRYPDEYQKCMESNDKVQIEEFRDTYSIDTQSDETVVTGIIKDLYYFWNGRECMIDETKKNTNSSNGDSKEDKVYYNFDGATLTIKGNGPMKDLCSMSGSFTISPAIYIDRRPWKNYTGLIKKIVIEDRYWGPRMNSEAS